MVTCPSPSLDPIPVTRPISALNLTLGREEGWPCSITVGLALNQGALLRAAGHPQNQCDTPLGAEE